MSRSGSRAMIWFALAENVKYQLSTINDQSGHANLHSTGIPGKHLECPRRNKDIGHAMVKSCQGTSTRMGKGITIHPVTCRVPLQSAVEYYLPGSRMRDRSNR